MGGFDELKDNNLIGPLLVLTFMLRTLKLFSYILTFSFISAILFRFVLTVEYDAYGSNDFYKNGDCSTDSSGGFFDRCYGINIANADVSQSKDMIRLVYFTFTTLSTVGFGDYNPKSNVERLFVGFFMLFGVATFSYIMGHFIDILHKF